MKPIQCRIHMLGTPDSAILSRAPRSPIFGAMTAAAKSSAPKTDRRTANVRSIYRGVRVQATNGRSRFTLDQIKEAVEAAVAKNAGALADRPKA